MKRKTLLLCVGLLAVVGLLVAGCAPEAAPTTPGATTPSPSTTPTTPSQPAEKTITFKIQTSWPAAEINTKYGLEICKLVTSMSGGRLKFDGFAGGSIVPQTEEIDAVDRGALDGCYTNTMYNIDKWPEAGLFGSVPGGLTPDANVIWFESYGIDYVNKMAEGYDVIALPGICPQAAEVFAHSTKKLETLADIQGLKMRTSGDGGEIMSRLGASVVFMPGGELYEAMQRGVIDAFEYGSPSQNWAVGFQEVAKYVIFSATRAPSDPLVFYLSKSKWEGLPADLQEIVMAAVQKATRQHKIYLATQDIIATKQFADYGCDVYHLPAEIELAVMQTAKAFYDERATSASAFYREVLESQRAFNAAYNQQNDLNAPKVSLS